VTNFLKPSPGLYAAGQPSLQDFSALAQEGVRTVINLRGPAEQIGFDEAAETERLGMRYVTIPIAGAQDLVPDVIARFSRELHDARASGPVLIHCGSSNRVGAMLALDAGITHGASLDAALSFGRNAGLSALEPAVEALLRASQETQPRTSR
jgi:uncharacterized protein (TIGR01244 family)